MDCSLGDLLEVLGHHEIGDKDGEALIPALFSPCPAECRNHRKAKGVDCGGGNQHRLNANVITMTGLGVDLDDLGPGDLERVLEQLQAREVLCFWWHTHSHTPEAPRARVLIPFAAPVPLKSAQQWSRLLWPALLEHFGLKAPADPSACDPSRVYYLPRQPGGGAHQAGTVDADQLFDAVGFLQPLLDRPAVAQEAIAGPLEDLSRPVDLEDVRARLKTIDREPTRTLLRRLLKGEALTAAPDVREKGEPSRYVAWRTVTGAVAAKAEDWEATEALIQLLHPSWAAEVTESPNDYTEWETVEKLFESARAGMPALRAQREAERAAAHQRLKAAFVSRMRPRTPEVTVSLPEPDPAEEEGDPEAPDPAVEADPAQEWFDTVVWAKDKDGNTTKPLQIPANAEATLRLFPEWRGVLRYNELTHFAEMHGGPLLPAGTKRELQDHHGPEVADWLCRCADITLKDSQVWARMLSVAHHTPYDPLKDYLRDCYSAWDKTPRLNSWLVTYMRASTTSKDGRDLTKHLETVGRKWLLSAAARGLKPGCKADVVLELEGGQGTKKSTALQILGGEWHTDEKIDPSNKDSLILIAGKWIVELGELETFQRATAQQLKRFFSQTQNDLRSPYGRTIARYLRRCVFSGTTNSDDYLTDETGNRRHWPVAAGDIDVAALARDRDQLWGEAAALFFEADTCDACKADFTGRCDAHKWWLTPEEAIMAENEAEARMGPDVITEAVQNWLLAKPPAGRPVELTTHQIITEALKDIPSAQVNATKIGRAMKILGCTHSQRRVAGVRRWIYLVPEQLRTAQRVGNSTIAALTGGKKADEK